MNIRRISTVALGALLVATSAEARPRTFGTCAVTQPRATSAFFRRLGRDAGNVIARAGVNLDLPATMADGVPIGPTARPFGNKLRRIWGHTESKIQRKCRDADAAAIFPGDGATVPDVVDDLFTRYGLPWVINLRAVVAPYGAECAQRVLIQAGRAVRDQIKRGRDRWAFYLRDTPEICAPGVDAAVRAVTMSTLADLL